jgi:HKD family nuclease
MARTFARRGSLFRKGGKILAPSLLYDGSAGRKPMLRTLVGDGCAVVVGLPRHFEVSEALRSAKVIRLATAFAHVSGWKSLKTDIEASSGEVFLLTGLQYNQTEPALLKDWLQLKLTHIDRIGVNLAADTPFFHPKVLIVHTPKKQFAIVGSGNLSKGGLQTNCECGVFVEDASTLNKLCRWFDTQFADGDPLNTQMIVAYEPDYKKAKKQAAALAEHQKSAEKKIKAVSQASFASWNRALNMAEAYFRDKDFSGLYAGKRKAARRLLEHLNAPEFDFDRVGWNRFYEEGVLGKLNEIYRDRVFNAGTRLRKALRKLVENPSAAIPDVLGRKGNLRIKGFAVNTVSKILAAYSPLEWPVYNSRVAAALADFGYRAPRGAGPDGRYIAFRNAMKKFMAACKERGLRNVDAISLDAFFFDRSQELGY